METKTWTNKTIKYGWKKDKVNPNDDSGAELRDGITSLHEKGV